MPAATDYLKWVTPGQGPITPEMLAAAIQRSRDRVAKYAATRAQFNQPVMPGVTTQFGGDENVTAGEQLTPEEWAMQGASGTQRLPINLQVQRDTPGYGGRRTMARGNPAMAAFTPSPQLPGAPSWMQTPAYQNRRMQMEQQAQQRAQQYLRWNEQHTNARQLGRGMPNVFASTPSRAPNYSLLPAPYSMPGNGPIPGL